MLLNLTRRLFLSLPLSEDQRRAVLYRLFELTGDRYKGLPSYQHYARQVKWRSAPLPADLLDHRAEVLNSAVAVPNQGSISSGDHRQGARPARTVVMISHDQGGGTEQHVNDMIFRLGREGWRTLLLQRHNSDHVRVIWRTVDADRPMFYRWPTDVAAMTEDFRRLGVVLLHLHHTIDLPQDFASRFVGVANELGVPFDVTLHDYFSVCPRFTMYDEGVQGYCGEPTDVRKCTACVKHHDSAVGANVDVRAWRACFGDLLNRARRVYAPDADVAERMNRYFPGCKFAVRPHPEDHAFHQTAKPYGRAGPLKVVVIGAIGPHKGSHVIAACATDAIHRRLPIEFHIVGFTDIDPALSRLKNVHITGAFRPSELTARLAAGGYHIAFLPAVWPETYSYALSDCWKHGLFTVGFDIGAIGSRLRAAPALGAVLPYEWYLRPEKVNDAILATAPNPLEAERVHAALSRYTDISREYYQMDFAT